MVAQVTTIQSQMELADKAAPSIATIVHPCYKLLEADWEVWRLTYEAGDAFIRKYLKKFSKHESEPDFADRKDMAHVPAHAKGAINKIKNGIFQRLIDVAR